MNVQQQFLKKGHRYRPGGSYKKTSITIHSTSNSESTAQNERAWLDNPSNTRQASWHYVAGEDVIIQAIPDEEEAWHCGKSEGNKHSIGIELIESGNRAAVIENAADFVAEKMKEYDFSIDDIYRHFDWTGKDCPRILIDPACIQEPMAWDYFLDLLERHRKEGDIVEKRYQTIAELPEYGKSTIEMLVEKGFLSGREDNLDISEDMLRVFVVLDRAGLFK